MRTFGENGHVVIVGRAGVALTRHIPLSIHIRLIAPIEWRIKSISDMYNLSREESIKMIALKDENRRKFLEYYLGHKFQIDVFDLAINCSRYSLEEIADSIIGLMKIRKMT
ncbi:MAG: cytidylate kinase family protein [Bacteroidota bacterium]